MTQKCSQSTRILLLQLILLNSPISVIHKVHHMTLHQSETTWVYSFRILPIDILYGHATGPDFLLLNPGLTKTSLHCLRSDFISKRISALCVLQWCSKANRCWCHLFELPLRCDSGVGGNAWIHTFCLLSVRLLWFSLFAWNLVILYTTVCIHTTSYVYIYK